jgi:hypothetical protein
MMNPISFNQHSDKTIARKEYFIHRLVECADSDGAPTDDSTHVHAPRSASPPNPGK